tara:strand:- start:2714 stop:3148 length:435 start_codon:yes stop_codon:yes gene_type:complete
MTFSQSVRSALIDNYANFKGTASRSEYWWFALFFVLVIFVVSFVFGIVIAMTGFGQAAIGIVVGVLMLALIVPTLAVWVRRCHDGGRSTGEAVVIFVLVNVVSLATPVGGGFVEVSGAVQTLAWVAFGLAALYTLYLATKKGNV